jgi:ribosomal protein S12 methylthiotransferase
MASKESLRVSAVSLGCPKALVDSERMLALLAEAGCLVGAAADDADVILINTCSFIAPARDESMAAIREAVGRKARGRVRRVVVAGCLPQMQGEALLAAEPGIDAIVGVFDRDGIVSAVTGEGPLVSVGPPGRACADDRGRFRLTPRHTAYLRLAEGCSQGCSFCTIPAIRGPLRSKPMELVLAEAAELVADGAVELNLIAQDTTAYGKDLPAGGGLAELLRRLDALAGVRWIRLMYAHPANMTAEVIEALAGCRRVVKYLDLPLQHVNDRLLALMRRRYGRRDVERTLSALREGVPGIALRTTFMVGFPGERTGEFAELLAFVKAQAFEAVGVFPYWREEGTPAAKMPGQVARKTKLRRRDRLMRAQREIALAANAARVGSTVEVLVDGADTSGRCVGRHAGQAPDVDGVCYLAEPVEAGRIVPARVVGHDEYDLVVERIDNREA